MFNKRIYFISGFDPRGARFYHRLFREEAKKSEKNSGATISTLKRNVIDTDITQWQVNSVWNKQSYLIDYRFMSWNDVMKHYWVSNVWLLIVKSLPIYCKHICTGLFAKFRRAGKGPFLFGLAPFAFSVAGLLATVLVGFLTYMLTLLVIHQVWLAAVLALLVGYFLIKYAMHLGENLGVWWVMQSYFFHSRWIENPLPELEKKMQAFAERILQDQVDSPVDEIILVGHCTGATLTVCVAANIFKMQHDALKDKLSVVTLGQCIPYVSYGYKAQHFRKSLESFANNTVFPWYDMGARTDPLCFQQVNPAMADGITLNSKNVPYRFVVKPYNMFSAEKYKKLQKNRLRIHFQYLMAADIKTDFDYFEIVTGAPASLQNYRT